MVKGGEEAAIDEAETHAQAVHERIVGEAEVADDNHHDSQQLQAAQGLKV